MPFISVGASAMQSSQADQERAAQGLQGWCARYVYYAKGRGQCGSVSLHQILTQ
jgi:hypothetical protein